MDGYISLLLLSHSPAQEVQQVKYLMRQDYGCKCRHHKVLSIGRFRHQLGCGERSGGLGTTKFHVFLARVFLDMSQETYRHNVIEFLGQTGAGWGWGLGMGFGDGDEMELNLGGQTWWCSKLPWW